MTTPPLLKNLSLLVLAAACALSALRAADPVPPKPQNVLTPDQSLQRLIEGNKRYVSGQMKSHDFLPERASLAAGQNPFASILSCADSRIAPEYAFDTGRGDLFVVRVAGNFVSKEGLASLEYGSLVLNSPLIVVLGHDSCGAVTSTIKGVTQNAKFPGQIPSLVDALKPAVKAAQGEKGDLLANATRENVRLNVEKLKESNPILREAVRSGRLKIVGAIYHLADGRVEFL